MQFGDYDEADEASGPVRKGTLSKDLRPGTVKHTMQQVMNRANLLGLCLMLLPPALVVAVLSGNFQLLAAGVACTSGVSSLGILSYLVYSKLLGGLSGKTKGSVQMIGFALYMTVPLFLLSGFFWYLSFKGRGSKALV